MSGPGVSPALPEELRDLCEQIDNIKEDALELSAPLDESQWNWKPAPARWSIAECLTHLNVVNGLDLPQITDVMKRGRADGWTGTGPFRYGFLSRRFVRMSEAPGKIKMRAPKVYLPSLVQSKEIVVAEFLSIHDRLRQLVVESNGLDLARIKVPSPFPWVKFPLGARFAVLTAHDRRHLRQAWEARKQPDFPV
ncbi:MAG TPA: DinB family protein [Bryobacteraceae bacterium]|nr:DinB family protein [Bryobacteraceae bacterium]